MLVQHLREMERDELVTRTDMSGKLPHVEYSLTNPLGLAAVRLLGILAQWATDYRSSELRQDDLPNLVDT
jgi:DNA-binding HxlR family transcriptional regulator